MSKLFRRSSLLFATALLMAGCAAGAPAPTTAPGPAQAPAESPPDPAPDLLAPSEAARRTAERVELTGLELGKMWTFQDPPVEWWEEQYDFAPTPEWLEHVQLASLRYGEGCSASFVSEDGLVMTNHHCARGCIEDLSTAEDDYLEDG
ncbi:MAG: S46 family peptidase, partial [Gemmatimonadetes bacterium]|nr:S46 family peptidase [Gemmatimonadota bacterium]NIQ55947.1 S46 family peptidase [Gemmatimonadota bacterium]NIU76140.1 S46 family peptidase [Gammaproteobacteria bacterium]NIX45684.1 S46 family peptidase [Gemmatimonadota bacterium]NIY09991.1 S46 family peptidase [Gemmatimonadota bacterium]